MGQVKNSLLRYLFTACRLHVIRGHLVPLASWSVRGRVQNPAAMCLPFPSLSHIISASTCALSEVCPRCLQSFIGHDRHPHRVLLSSFRSSDSLSRFPTGFLIFAVTLPQGRQVGSRVKTSAL